MRKVIYAATGALFMMALIADGICAQSGDVPLDTAILRAVVMVESFPGPNQVNKGTGFIVSHDVQVDSAVKRLEFLVTNKHMLSDWTLADGTISKFSRSLKIHFYKTDNRGSKPDTAVSMQLCDDQGQVMSWKVAVHADSLVDIGIVCLDSALQSLGGMIKYKAFDISGLLRFESIVSQRINVGSQVFALGYPHGVTSEEDYLPMVKYGFLSYTPGKDFSITITDSTRSRVEKLVRLTGKLLIIDGLMVPGNSGGPVIIPSAVKFRINEETGKMEHTAKATQNFIIGVMAGGFPETGLSYSLSSDYVIETINQYLERMGWAPLDK